MREDRLGARTPPTDAWRGGCAGGAARDDSIAPHPPRRRKPGAVGGLRPCAGDRDERAGGESATNQVEVRPVSGRKGSGRREDARTPRRQGVKAIWRLPNPRGARRNARPRKSRDRRKPDAPVLHTHPPHTRPSMQAVLPPLVTASAQKKVGNLQNYFSFHLWRPCAIILTMKFVCPWMLILVALVPLAGAFWIFLRARAERRLEKIVASSLAGRLLPAASGRSRVLRKMP